MQKDRYSCNPFREFKLEPMCTLEEYYRIFFKARIASFVATASTFSHDEKCVKTTCEMRVTHAASF